MSEQHGNTRNTHHFMVVDELLPLQPEQLYSTFEVGCSVLPITSSKIKPKKDKWPKDVHYSRTMGVSVECEADNSSRELSWSVIPKHITCAKCLECLSPGKVMIPEVKAVSTPRLPPNYLSVALPELLVCYQPDTEQAPICGNQELVKTSSLAYSVTCRRCLHRMFMTGVERGTHGERLQTCVRLLRNLFGVRIAEDAWLDQLVSIIVEVSRG